MPIFARIIVFTLSKSMETNSSLHKSQNVSMPIPQHTAPSASSAKLSIHPFAAQVTKSVPNERAIGTPATTVGCAASDGIRRPTATNTASVRKRATMMMDTSA